MQMNISGYMKQTPVFSAKNWIAEMETLLKSASASGNFPFSGGEPPPENTNLITGNRPYDLNAQRIDLHAASAGISRSLWLFSADAEILGLELKDGQKPLLIFANITAAGHEPRLEAHHAYLLDQFSPETISRLYEYASPESINLEDANSRRRYSAAKSAVLNIANYDSGIMDKPVRLSAVKHIRENSDPRSPAYEDARDACRYYSSRSRADVFSFLRKYYTWQVSGNPLDSQDSQNSREHKLSLAALLSDVPETIRSMFHARVFVQRLTQENFFLDYSRSNPPRAAFIQQDEPGLTPSRSPFPERARR
jgi:hypothetical protein